MAEPSNQVAAAANSQPKNGQKETKVVVDIDINLKKKSPSDLEFSIEQKETLKSEGKPQKPAGADKLAKNDAALTQRLADISQPKKSAADRPNLAFPAKAGSQGSFGNGHKKPGSDLTPNSSPGPKPEAQKAQDGQQVPAKSGAPVGNRTNKPQNDENQKEASDQQNLEEEQKQPTAQQPKPVLKPEVDPLIAEGVTILNEFINGFLTDLALGVWVAGGFTLGLGILIGAILGDFLWAFKKPLIKFALKRLVPGVHMPLLKSDMLPKLSQNIDYVADKIKFSLAVKANIIAMNLIILAVIILILIVFAGTLWGACNNFITKTALYFSGYSEICKTFEGLGGGSGGAGAQGGWR